MIIEGLLNVIKSLIFNLLSVFDIPSIEDTLINDVYNFFHTIVSNGQAVFGFFVPAGSCRVLFGVVLSMVLMRNLYALVIWIVRKIPLVSIN